MEIVPPSGRQCHLQGDSATFREAVSPSRWQFHLQGGNTTSRRQCHYQEAVIPPLGGNDTASRRQYHLQEAVAPLAPTPLECHVSFCTTLSVSLYIIHNEEIIKVCII
ncbi:hypothetical protein OTU49_001253, partial [Cherax quadricarinatus]